MAASAPRPPARRRLRLALRSAAAGALALVAACSGSSGGGGSSPAAPGVGAIQVVAAENFWGSIAGQLGGEHVKVTNIISNPDADPHDYEPTAGDARTVAGARYVVVNGVGYDAWATKLLAANPVSGRTMLTVGELVGVKEGGNPHRWYSPSDVHRVIEQITADYKRIDPADAAYFDRQKTAFESQALGRYNQLISDIRTRYADTPIGASESIVTPLAEDLKLKLLTPESFLDAVSEGTDPTAQDKATVDQQIGGRQIKVYVYNRQNSTPDVQAQVKAAEAQGIPVTTVTETPDPPGASFQDWQVGQLRSLEQALATATGR
ncbi:metal ABC transporter solute-binding protein, Zn/Mn family [Kitasatospora sp. NPDC085464]|uniref:metal ABC transporter solute-binding protein, Zn/Mn family n=1 Tax=Kitasatospora sp. NPDC085464 TaxID=3364063 RepID=UPI0037C51C2A